MLLIKNPKTILTIYFSVCFLAFISFFILYIREFIIPNEKHIKETLVDLNLAKLLGGQIPYALTTSIPFIVVSMILVYGIINYFGKIRNITFSTSNMEIKSRFITQIHKNEITEIELIEKDNEPLRAILKTVKNQYLIHKINQGTFDKIIYYFELNKPIQTFDDKLKISKKLYTKSSNQSHPNK